MAAEARRLAIWAVVCVLVAVLYMRYACSDVGLGQEGDASIHSSNSKLRDQALSPLRQTATFAELQARWDDRPPPFRRLYSPVVFKNTSAQQLARSQYWTPSLMIGRSAARFVARVGKLPEMVFYDGDSALEDFPPPGGWHNVSLVRVRGSRLFSLQRVHPYIYWSGEATRSTFQATAGWRSFLPPNVTAEDVSFTGLWMGTDGVVARGHYDAEHNLYVGLRGRKRWSLCPLSEETSMLLYPKLSPHFRQLQIPWLKDVEGRRRSEECVDGTILPGEVLYVPPFWLHRVECVADSGNQVSESKPDGCISMNFWLPSAHSNAQDDLDGVLLPFEGVNGEGWLRTAYPESEASISALRRRAVLAFLWLILSHPHLRGLTQSVIVRYDRLYGNEVRCHATNTLSLCEGDSTSVIDSSNVDLVRSAAEVHEAMKALPNHHGRILIANLVEDMAAFAVGGERARVFIACCCTSLSG